MTSTHHIDDITLMITTIVRDDDESRRDAERRTTLDLIHSALGDSVDLDHQPSGAPCLIGSNLYISISHSLHYAAIALSPSGPIGIDIEESRQQLRRVAPRVLSDKELDAYSVTDALLLRAWTLKEALYKAALTPGLDFRHDILLPLPPADTIARIKASSYTCSVLTTPDYTVALAQKFV